MSFRVALAALLFASTVASCADPRTEKSTTPPLVTSISQLTHDGASKTNVLSDSSNLYVTESSSAHHVVATFSLQNADRSLLSGNFSDIQALDISLDQTKLLISGVPAGANDNELWALPMNSGTPEKLGTLTGGDASWSPDGSQVVFAKGATLSIAKSDGSSARELYTAEGSVFAPHFSLDGNRIRFSVGNTAQNTTTIWEIGQDGTTPHAFLGSWQHANAACCGKWSADGHYYIFQVTQNVPTTVTTLWALSERARNAVPVQMTNGPMSFGNVSLAQDNKRLFAVGVRPVGQPIKYAGKGNFVPLLPGISATDLDFSPDGKWVTYVAIPEGTLWRCRADGSNRLQLTSAPERAALPHWSPGGHTIAYVSMRTGKPWKLAVIPAGGGNPEDVLDEDRSQIDANWSSDGTRIMFGYLHDGKDINIRIVNLATHEVTSVPGSEGLFSPRWSPNGRYIAALSPDFTKVMLFDYQTQRWTNWLTEAAGAVSYPVWSADSKHLYFDDSVTDEESIRSVKVGDSHTERVFKLEGLDRYPGPFGQWSGRTPNGSWIFVRDRSTQEVYELSVVLP
jgi:Tol biopolymer transport system component